MMAKISILLTSLVFLLACCVLFIRGQEEVPTVVQTLYGKVRGRLRQHPTGAKVIEFFGIPYAAPPVGDLRFKKTVKPANRTEGILDAYRVAPACPQYSDQPLPWYDLDSHAQSEDCLYLNIWAPFISYRNRQTKIYVHGGGWFEGGSNRMGYYDGFGEALDTVSADGTSLNDGVIVVTVNYRLGVHGFLASGMPDEAAGNMGLFDLAQAVEWLFDNLKYFGGQQTKWLYGSENIMLVGQGSGAIAVSLLRMAVTRISDFENLKVILNGASFLTLKALEGVDEEGDAYVNNLRLTNMLAEALGCPTPLWKNRKATITCLKGVEASRLVKVAASLSNGTGPPNVFLPQIKGPDMFFFLDPFKALYDFPFRFSQVLATFTTDEGSNLLTSAFPKTFGAFGEKDVVLSAACAKKITRKLLKKFPRSVADELLGDLNPNPTATNRKKLVDAIGDAFFICPMVNYLEETVQFTNVGNSYARTIQSRAYLLEKEVYPPYNPWAPWMGSVGFNNVQIDFVHANGQLRLLNHTSSQIQTYNFTDEQKKQEQIMKELRNTFQKMESPSILRFSPLDRNDSAHSYSTLHKDGKVSSMTTNQINIHKKNCDILRPYFRYQEKL